MAAQRLVARAEAGGDGGSGDESFAAAHRVRKVSRAGLREADIDFRPGQF
jgi:hypothetical protein